MRMKFSLVLWVTEKDVLVLTVVFKMMKNLSPWVPSMVNKLQNCVKKPYSSIFIKNSSLTQNNDNMADEKENRDICKLKHLLSKMIKKLCQLKEI